MDKHYILDWDVFAYRRAELETMQAEGNAFVMQALRESRVLF